LAEELPAVKAPEAEEETVLQSPDFDQKVIIPVFREEIRKKKAARNAV
jgi:hypothetical protein